MKNSVLVTITGLAHYYGTKPFKVGGNKIEKGI